MTVKKFNEYSVWKAYVDMHMADANFETAQADNVFSVFDSSGELIAWFIKSAHNGAVDERRLVDREFSDG